MADLRDEDCGRNPPSDARRADSGSAGNARTNNRPERQGPDAKTPNPSSPREHPNQIPDRTQHQHQDQIHSKTAGPHDPRKPEHATAHRLGPRNGTGPPGHQKRSAANPSPTRANEIYGALDLGTNNCRLLLARPSRRGFRVTDAFSRIIRLGEGVSRSGNLSPQAIARTIDALKVCSAKLDRSQVTRARLVATQACRIAHNAQDFLDTVREEVGLDIEILSEEDEARLAVSGCASLIDVGVDYVLVFDIGGGSSELIWLDLSKRRSTGRTSFVDRLEAQDCMVAWTSLPVGVVTLAEHFGGTVVEPDQFDDMVDHVMKLLQPFENKHRFQERIAQKSAHLLGTSGTITTVAGIKLDLRRYDRNRVDGCWLSIDDAHAVTNKLLGQTHEQRLAEPCIGRERADLVLAGCAILEALIQTWPCERLRVADRGLREGILATLMSEDGVYRTGRRRGGRRHRTRS